MKRYISWSGGKDSSASIILCYEKGIHIDGVIISEVMFDHSRNISGEDPKHIEWIYNTAIPIIEKQFGYKVNVLKDNRDYVSMFKTKIKNSKVPERNGQYVGFVLAGKCYANSRLKMRPIEQWKKKHNSCEYIVGIAVDEPERLARLKPNCRSILAENKITEKMTYEICKKYNLLSPTYENATRGGCWFCPNKSIKELAYLKKQYPYLWDELKQLNNLGNLCGCYFKYSETLDSIERRIDLINNQMTIFDFLNENNKTNNGDGMR